MTRAITTLFFCSLFCALSAQTIVWKQVASLPEGYNGGEAVSLNNEIYFVSGRTKTSKSSLFYKFNPNNNQWVKLADVPEPATNLALAAVKGKFYAIGGDLFKDTNREYNPQTNTWRILEPMPTARQHIDCGFFDNNIFVMGGLTSWELISKKNEAYNIATNTWSEKAAVPSLRNCAAIVTMDSLIYVIGGGGSEASVWEKTARVDCYNTKSNTWVRKADLPYILYKPAAIVVNNKLVVLGGSTTIGENTVTLDKTLIYNSESDEWIETTPLPSKNIFFGCASVGNKIYVIGGTAGSESDWLNYPAVYEGELINSEVDVCYVGNAGFLIKIGDKKILVDALFKGFAGDYNLPEQIQEKLTLAQAPFDHIDLIVVTHAHGDHIDANMVQQHMKNNSKAIFASTKQTVDALNARDTLDNFHERRIGFNPSKEKSDLKDIKGISIEAFYLPHGSESRIINNGFLISVNGVSFFHTGDVDFDQFTFEEFQSLQLPEKKIDLSFIQHFYLTSDSTSRQFVNKGIGGKYILPIHYHFTTPSFDAAIVEENYPDAILFDKELESWKMPAIGNDFTTQKGYYFNQALPGDSAVIFAPGIVSVNGRYEFGVSFTPDLEEIYFTGKRKGESSSIYFSKLIDNKWTNPQKANLTNGKKKDEMEAFVNHSGKKIYFTASDSKGVEIWCATRSGNWWTNAIKLDSPINDDMVFYSNEAKNGDLFYKNVSKGKMYYAPNRNGKFPEIFEAGIEYGSHGFIAPSQDFILIDAKKENDKTKDKDIHVCFKKKDGTWTKPINLGREVNSNFNETCPSLTPDGKFIFFSRYNEEGGIPNIYWASSEIIGKLKEKAFKEVKLTEDLFEAVDAGDLAKVKALIKSDPTLLEIKDRSASTPLIRACFNPKTFGRQVEVAKFLIETGANVNAISNYSKTALIQASLGRGPDYELIKLLISKGADINIQGLNGLTALHYAVGYNELEIVKFLLESGADINISDDYNGPISPSTFYGNILQIAIKDGRSNEMVEFVIKNGAKLNNKDSQGNTELHLVTLKGNTEQAKILIKHGIDLDAKNNFNRTALYYAANKGYRGLADLLITSGADKNTIGETNYGKAKQLSESMDEGEAYIWGSNILKTKNNLLVFTVVKAIGETSESGLANGRLNADELKDQKITMFLRHRSYYQMKADDFREMANLTPDTKIVSSFNPDFSKTEESEIPDYHLALPNESFSLDGLKVHPIAALAGGMGYLVEVDGLKIFHTGLHISDDKADHIEKFRKEIDFLKPFGPIDIVMLTTQSHSNHVGTGYEQYLYLIDELAPKAIYLWGANVPENNKNCADFLKVRNIPIVYSEEGISERSHYKADQAHKSPALKGTYLGQTPPGMTPEIFAPVFISGNGRLHCFPTFSNDNKEIYWMIVPPQIMTMKENSQGWSAPDTAAFAVGTINQAPFVSHDDRIYFSSPRTGGKGAYDIWYVMQIDGGYSTPINIGSEINSDQSESQPTVSNNNTIFYTGSFEGKLYNRGIYCSRFENGKYQTPVALPEPINIINENNLDYTPFIASDESYLLFCSNRQNPEKELCHIYISYKNSKGEWEKPIDLSLKMNFTESSKFPYVTPDKKFLFFSSGANIYWVDAEIIDDQF